MMAWIHGTEMPFYQALQQNIETLQSQMHTAEPAPDMELGDDMPSQDAMMRYMRRWRG